MLTLNIEYSWYSECFCSNIYATNLIQCVLCECVHTRTKSIPRWFDQVTETFFFVQICLKFFFTVLYRMSAKLTIWTRRMWIKLWTKSFEIILRALTLRSFFRYVYPVEQSTPSGKDFPFCLAKPSILLFIPTA